MNLDQFRAMLTLCDGIEGRTVLPVPDPSAERIFGGQTMAQLIVAAAPPGSAKAVKSLQIAFPRAGRAAGPLHLDLEQTHDGRSLGHRRAVAWASQRDADVSVQTGVVTHSVWFHQPLDVARWLRGRSMACDWLVAAASAPETSTPNPELMSHRSRRKASCGPHRKECSHDSSTLRPL
ncbi:palmitoyl-CoA hydrolase [Mycobacterium vulneris]|jgi:acyl-CoA thioesterase|uniref:Palmitoyl-CoA hydrolase n=1 Tax=Mycolicibacterium vulneris TaxID=547163 RepID=A0A1X2LBX3_9MYCO|nr:acyl-CoA thioesterase domain-containing protein [Mycolicibacterium vulneris]OSC31519.1 palmitoyl-CoA hydrolase [Mycolicibacterium vulneris]